MSALYTYFGLVGILSIAAWAAVGALLLALVARRRRPAFYLAALGLLVVAVPLGLFILHLVDVRLPARLAAWVAPPLAALLALVTRRHQAIHWAALGLALAALALAELSSHFVSQIREDQSEYLKQAEQARQDERREDLARLRSRAADIRFAEDTPADPLDLAGVDAQAARKVAPGDGPDAAPAPEEPDYAYRQAGRKERSPDAKRPADAKEPADKGLAHLKANLDQATEAAPQRTLPPAEHALANRLDRLNLFAARSAVWVALLMVLVDYLRTFNRSLGSFWTVPIAGPAVDWLSPKRHAVYLQTAGTGAVREYLQEAVRKGETFIYFGPDDPWPAARLHRLALFGRGLAWPLPKLAFGPEPPPLESHVLFESAWFGRYALVLTGEALAQALLADLVAYLEARRAARASARRTVHVVWTHERMPPPDRLRDVVFLVRETNFRLLLARPQPPDPDVAPWFEECLAVGGTSDI